MESILPSASSAAAVLPRLGLVLLLVLAASLGAAAEPPLAETAVAAFSVEGMTCGGCVGAVKAQLKRTPGVVRFEVALERRMSVLHRFCPASGCIVVYLGDQDLLQVDDDGGAGPVGQ